MYVNLNVIQKLDDTIDEYEIIKSTWNSKICFKKKSV